MNNAGGVNSLIVGLTFLSGLSIGNIVVSLLAAVAVGVLSKAADKLINIWLAERSNRWKQKAIAETERADKAEARLRELQEQSSAAQLSR